MDSFHGKDPASLAFQRELLQLISSCNPEDLHGEKHSSLSTFTDATSPAHQEDSLIRSSKVNNTQDQPIMRSFLDLSLTSDVRQATRQSFKFTSNRWRSIYAMAHPPFGTFKFIYSSFGTIDYESCFGAEENVYLNTSSVGNYPRPNFSWLHVVPNVAIEDGSEREVSETTEDPTIHPDINSLAKTSEPTLITQPERSVIPMKTMYIPPHKRVETDTSHSRDQSESSVPASKSAISGRKKKKYQSLDLTPSQKTLNVPRRISTGNTHVPFSGFQPILALDDAEAESTETNLQSEVRLSDQTKYKGTGQGTKAIENLEDHLNCSIFVKHLPEDVQFHEIFAIINTGSVICLHIMPPTLERGFAAAKIIFKYPEGAARFIEANKQREIRIRDHRLAVVYNDHGMVRHAQEHQSRVIYIEGPHIKMNETFWRGYFETITNFNLEYVGYLPTVQAMNGARMMEFRFSRVEAQAQTILIAILNDHQFDGTVTARYGDDPCGSC